MSGRTKIAVIVLGICVLWSLPPGVCGEPRARHLSSQFQVRLFDERLVTYKEIQGKITVIDFWGTWCKPCLAEIPDNRAFYRDYRDKGVVFMALAGESGSAEKVREKSQRLNIDYPAGAPSKAEFKTIGKIGAYPTTWVIAPSGEIVKEFVGAVPGKQKAMREIVDRLLERESR
jgi:thiol-disulfide isomerase/thioredoxin